MYILQKMIKKKKEKTNPNCQYYNWGGDLDKGYTTYPREYGARCEFYKRFFSKDVKGNLIPNCYSCGNKLESKVIK